ncbi:T9SS type A sorting domain-containing protein [Fodinibius sp. Rm-B-1B1-1]|uniref:T9SS type A sorting domain-containing protein n=1 Tax=Fodinibius alkaliphilus TaxID=3140241 RepID=UPI00315AD975
MLRSKKVIFGITVFIILIIAAVGTWYGGGWEYSAIYIAESSTKLDPVEKKRARTDYFFNLLRDPATNSIPENIRSRELNHAQQLRGGRGLRKSGSASMQQVGDISWHLAGPVDLGGRTRALAFDRRNADIVLAGGVSGGMWKSIDGGNTWQLKTDPNQDMSVTSVAQDPTEPDTWYYATGELRGNSAGDRGGRASYFGTGIYKSTDNGESWSRLSSTEDTDIAWNSEFDFISRIIVNPVNGDVYFAANGGAIYRSTNGGGSFSNVLGNLGGHRYADVIVNKNGTLLAALSERGAGAIQTDNPGIYRSTDDGQSWIDVTPSDFPATHDRTYLAFAPSAPDTAYAFTYEGSGSGSNENISFFMMDFANDASEDRSGNLPDFGNPVGFVNTQFNYNMVMAVKPDDPDLVVIGTTNLFRSRDGFATTPAGGYDNSDINQKQEFWVGGYDPANNVSQYPNQHPDQHVLVFQPNDPNTLWAGHDGGLSATTDITAAPVSWEDKDEGYVTGQFYTVEIPDESGDDRYLGGTQDNGTPFFRFDESNSQATTIEDISSGDGSYAHWGTDYAYVSSQMGNVLRLTIESDGSITSPYEAPTGTWSFVQPSGATNQLFVHPYAVDPNDDTIMYYPGGTTMWRNTEMDEISNYNQGSTTTGWESFEGTSSTGYTISTLEVTSMSPSDRLYYGASSSTGTPEIFRLNNASTSDTPTEISIGGASAGAYVHDIAVNPLDGDEVIAVMSNYSITGLYHSLDAGNSWTAIEGNLEGDSQDPGPSLRDAEILPTEEGNIYLVGTSTGIYTTMTLDGNSTSWQRTSDDGSPESIGYSVVEYLDVRPSDGTIAVGSHGRGIFVGRAEVGDVVVEQLPVIEDTLEVVDDWQLVGSPMTSDAGAEPGSDLQLYEYSGTYKSVANISSHKGYWTKSSSGSEISYSGEADTAATIALEKGWNLIGGVADTVGISAISDPNSILSSADIFEYSEGSYQSASDVKSFMGYWIHASEDGDIEILPDESSNKSGPVLASGDVGQLTFSNETASQQFYVSNQLLSTSEEEKYLMPPMAPEAVMDVRTDQGLRLAQGEQSNLKLTTDSYPVTVSSHPENSQGYTLKGVVGQDTAYYNLRTDEKVTLQRPYESLFLSTVGDNAQITEHNLKPNFPNPFTSGTQIRYQVASQSRATLEVYDVLGRKVQTLVDEQKSKGEYSIRFDGSNLSSGIYFIHLKVGETIKVQKMTLIK